VAARNRVRSNPSVPARITSMVARPRKFGRLAASIGLILATCSEGRAQGVDTGSPDSGADRSELQEITVTAQRRTENVQDIPYNITVVAGDQLGAPGSDNINDLTRMVPGLTTVDEGPGARGNTNNLTLRGLRTDGPGGAGGNATDIPSQTVDSVSTYFGETPVFFPMALYDIDRVEVLRGPQGTLYGSGAEAGTVRIIPKRPSFDGISGEVSASGGYTQGADGKPNRSIDGVLNIPLSSDVALRVVAGDEHLAGFINQVDLLQRTSGGLLAPPASQIPGDPTSGPVLAGVQKGTNSSDQWFTRAALRWRPAAGWDVEFDYLHQHTSVDDVQSSNPEYPGGVVDLGIGGDFPNSSFVARPGGTYDATNFILQPYQDTIDLASGVASVDMGLATFTSATSFYRDDSYSVSDVTGNYLVPGGTNFLTYPYYGNYPRAMGIETTPVSENSFTQEMRLVSNSSQALEYVAGLFFRNQRVSSDTQQSLPGITTYLNDIGMPEPYQGLPDLIYEYNRSTRFIDEAIFGEVTWHPTKAWQMTGGLRFFRQTFDDTTVQLLPDCSAICASNGVDPTGRNAATINTQIHHHIAKFNTSYDLTSTTKVYATYSEGFRRGGANALPTAGVYASLPSFQTFRPDYAKNYEVGVKGTALDQRVRYSADVFLIHLTDFQFQLSNLSGIPATYNGSRAETKGIELAAETRLTNRLDVTLGYTYTQATVTEPVSIYDLGFCGTPTCLVTSLSPGERLPGVPQHTATVATAYVMPLNGGASNRWSLTLHADAAYRGVSNSVIDTANRSFWVIPSSTSVNAFVTLSGLSGFSYTAFINNLTDSAGYSGGRGTAQDQNTLEPLPNIFATRVVARPRTAGLRIKYAF
jgi:iron complex outermembrane recepter protein